MALMSIVTSLQTGKPVFAITADDGGASYVFPPGANTSGLNDARLQRLVHRIGRPNDAAGWLKLAAYNIGNFSAAQPTEVPAGTDPSVLAKQVLSQPPAVKSGT